MIVVWRITQRCNLSCPFCAYDRDSSWPRREADASVIRLFGGVLAEYQRARMRRLYPPNNRTAKSGPSLKHAVLIGFAIFANGLIARFGG